MGSRIDSRLNGERVWCAVIGIRVQIHSTYIYASSAWYGLPLRLAHGRGETGEAS